MLNIKKLIQKEGIIKTYILNLDKLRVRRMKLKLVTFTANNCTVGKLWNGDDLICYTIEKKWNDNKPNISCVPAGHYQLNPTLSHKFGNTYCLESKSLGVSLDGNTKRTHILLHKANKASELQGCIAPVSGFGVLGGEWAGTASGKAYDSLMDALAGDKHKIEIVRL